MANVENWGVVMRKETVSAVICQASRRVVSEMLTEGVDWRSGWPCEHLCQRRLPHVGPPEQ